MDKLSGDVLLFVIGPLVVGCGFAAFGLWIGYHIKDMKLDISALRSRVRNLEDDSLPEPQVFEAKSPKEVVKYGEPDHEESQIITAKKPHDVRRDQDRKLQEEIRDAQ